MSSQKIQTFVQTGSAIFDELDSWQQIGEEEVEVVAAMVRRNEISGGTPVVRQFEKDWREWIGSEYCVTSFNGTTAIYSALFGLGVGPGDEVIVPVNTWIGSLAGALFLGARPVFCDIEPDTLLMDPRDMERRITPKTACIIPVHLWGNVCNLDAIMAIAGEHKLPVLEDCSHAHGAQYKGRMCGAIGDVACWSLQGSKAISAGEGGVVTTNSMDIHERGCLAGQVNRIAGIDLVSENYAQHQPLGLGMKLRAHPLGIGIASVQLRKINQLNQGRREYYEAVEQGLEQIPGLRPVRVHEGAERGGFYGMPILHDPEETPGLSTANIVQALKSRGICSEIAPYPLLHTLPLFAEGFEMFKRSGGPLSRAEGYTGYQSGDFPAAERAQHHALFIPRVTVPKPGASARVLEALSVAIETAMAGARA